MARLISEPQAVIKTIVKRRRKDIFPIDIDLGANDSVAKLIIQLATTAANTRLINTNASMKRRRENRSRNRQ